MLNPVFSRTSRQEGSSLIEVLVAIIVLSVGMLSMLWAQTKSMGFERTAEFRNIAAQIASEYADRIRANLNVDKGVARGDRGHLRGHSHVRVLRESWGTHVIHP